MSSPCAIYVAQKSVLMLPASIRPQAAIQCTEENVMWNLINLKHMVIPAKSTSVAHLIRAIRQEDEGWERF
jgi:rRNA processing protein Krr1/Pno1